MRISKLLAGILVLCLLLGMLPIYAAADKVEGMTGTYYTTEDDGSDPGDTSEGEDPEEDSEEDSEDDPEDDPEKDPEDDPEDDPEKDPEGDPEGDPEDDPKDGPEEKPEEKPAATPDPTPEDTTPLVGYLETEDHLVYFFGDDDLANPDGSLTRAEAASLINSLLSKKPQTVTLHFADVAEDAWYQKQVDTLAELGIVKGRSESEDGSLYAPHAKITRAEFATILSKFYPMETGAADFPDLDPSAWYYPFMVNAVRKGWISGYNDGTARPNANITRAEAVSMLNRLLGRYADKSAIDAHGKDGKILRFIDLSFTHWAYYQIMEASIPHVYVKSDAGAESWTNFAVPTAARKPGYRLYRGSLFKVGTDGYYVRNVSDGVIRFGNDGKYTTGDTALDTYVRNAVRANTVDSDTLENNWKRLYKYAAGSDFRYLTRGLLTDGQTGWENEKALQMFQTHKGNCYNYAAVATLLARSTGYQAVSMAGYAYMPQNGYYVNHGWTEITVEGVKYLADPQLQYVFAVNNGNVNWDLFMKRYNTVVPKYSWKGTVLQ